MRIFGRPLQTAVSYLCAFVSRYLCPSLMLMMIIATEKLLFGCYAIYCFIAVLLRIKSMMINS